MNEINAEQIYNLFHKETNLVKGRPVKSVVNFENAKSASHWPFFVRCADFINRNSGQVDYKIYIRALAKYFNGWFDPKLLGSQQSIKIYKNYLNQIEDEKNPEFIKGSIISSTKFVIEYCQQHNIICLDDYLNEDNLLIPTVIKHLNAGSISFYFLACIKNFNIIFESYPSDCKKDYFPNFVEKYSLFRTRIVANPELLKISQNIGGTIEKILQKK